MGRHGVLGGVERVVKIGEIGLEPGKVGPARAGTVVGVDIGGEDAVEQIPPLTVDRETVEIDQLRDRHDIAGGHIPPRCGQAAQVTAALFK